MNDYILVAFAITMFFTLQWFFRFIVVVILLKIIGKVKEHGATVLKEQMENFKKEGDGH